MERTTWTDERLDERMVAMDQTAERIFAELAGIREEMRAFRSEIGDLRSEVRSDIRDLRSDFNNFQDRMVQIGFALFGVMIASATTLAVTLVIAVT